MACNKRVNQRLNSIQFLIATTSPGCKWLPFFPKPTGGALGVWNSQLAERGGHLLRYGPAQIAHKQKVLCANNAFGTEWAGARIIRHFGMDSVSFACSRYGNAKKSKCPGLRRALLGQVEPTASFFVRLERVHPGQLYFVGLISGSSSVVAARFYSGF